MYCFVQAGIAENDSIDKDALFLANNNSDSL